MVDLETLSNMILDGLELTHTEEPDSNQNETFDEYSSNFLEHYGVLGMKWGVRKDRKPRVKRKDRRYEGETDAQYQARMQRESNERVAKTQAKARADSEKRAIREREASQRRTLKSQERIARINKKSEQKTKRMQLKADEKLRKEQEAQRLKQNPQQDPKKKTKSNRDKGKNRTPTSQMTDQEIRDAIARVKLEQEYINLTKKPKGIMDRTMKEVSDVGGGVLKATGKALATKYLTQYATNKIDSMIDKNAQRKIDKENAAKGVLYLSGTDKSGKRVGYDPEPEKKKKKR